MKADGGEFQEGVEYDPAAIGYLIGSIVADGTLSPQQGVSFSELLFGDDGLAGVREPRNPTLNSGGPGQTMNLPGFEIELV